MIGPITGPANGARQNKVMARPNSCGLQISVIEPPPTARQAEAENPAKNLKTKTDPMFFDKPTPIINNIETGKVEQ
ncbi:unnamed protein product [[Candida] boidinii]|nr:unnamed protein product [[Candida] boidinii]